MKKLLGLIVLAAAIAAIGRIISTVRRGGLMEKMDAFMEKCPPIQAMRKLAEQNEEVIGLLREQTAILRRQTPAEEVIESAYGETFVS